MREVGKDAAVYFVGRLIPAVIGMALVWILVRVLGTEGYGPYAVITSGANLLSGLTVGWLSQAVLRFQPGAASSEPFGRAIGISLVSVAVLSTVAAALLVTLNAITPATFGGFAAVLLLAMSLSMHATYSASLQAALRPRVAATGEVVRAVVSLPCSLAGATLMAPGFLGATMGIAVAYIASSSFCFLLSRRTIPAGASTREALALARRFLVFGWPISIWLGVSLVFPFAERTVIENVLGAAAVGEYSAVYDAVYRAAGFLLLPVVLAIHPRMMMEQQTGRYARLRQLWSAGLAIQLVGTALLTAASAAAAPWIVDAMSLDVGGEARRLVVPLAAAGGVWQLALIAQKLLEAERRTVLMLALLVISLIFCVAADVILVPTVGTIAAAYSLLLSGASYAISAGLAGFWLSRRTHTG
jgi:O-antigen/teichoic acid export membrane protein